MFSDPISLGFVSFSLNYKHSTDETLLILTVI